MYRLEIIRPNDKLVLEQTFLDSAISLWKCYCEELDCLSADIFETYFPSGATEFDSYHVAHFSRSTGQKWLRP